jgi:hypothetical protein
MVRVGDAVHPVFDMGKVGKVVEIKEVKNKTWMVGGAMSTSRVAVIELEDGTLLKYRVDDLMRIE